MFRRATLREAPPEMAPPDFVVAPTAGGAEFCFLDLHDLRILNVCTCTYSVKRAKKKKNLLMARKDTYSDSLSRTEV